MGGSVDSLVMASLMGRVADINKLLRAGVDIDALVEIPQGTMTALHAAAHMSEVSLVRFALQSRHLYLCACNLK